MWVSSLLVGQSRMPQDDHLLAHPLKHNNPIASADFQNVLWRATLCQLKTIAPQDLPAPTPTTAVRAHFAFTHWACYHLWASTPAPSFVQPSAQLSHQNCASSAPPCKVACPQHFLPTLFLPFCQNHLTFYSFSVSPTTL